VPSLRCQFDGPDEKLGKLPPCRSHFLLFLDLAGNPKEHAGCQSDVGNRGFFINNLIDSNYNLMEGDEEGMKRIWTLRQNRVGLPTQRSDDSVEGRFRP
jgi:hypothetical protein